MTISWPQRLFLLSHHAGKERLDDDSAAVRGSLLCAAAVAELRTAGWLRDRDGKAERVNPAPAGPLDPFLADVLGDVPPDRPRGWFDVLERGWPKAEETVENELAAAGFIAVGRRRVLGFIPAKRISVTDPGSVRALRDRVRDVVLRPEALSIEDAMLAVLAIEGNVGTVFGWRDLSGHKAAVRALNDRVDSDLPGLRSALIASIALRRTASA